MLNYFNAYGYLKLVFCKIGHLETREGGGSGKREGEARIEEGEDRDEVASEEERSR